MCLYARWQQDDQYLFAFYKNHKPKDIIRIKPGNVPNREPAQFSNNSSCTIPTEDPGGDPCGLTRIMIARYPTNNQA